MLETAPDQQTCARTGSSSFLASENSGGTAFSRSSGGNSAVFIAIDVSTDLHHLACDGSGRTPCQGGSGQLGHHRRDHHECQASPLEKPNIQAGLFGQKGMRVVIV